MKILFLAANPLGMSDIRLDKEVKKIEDSLRNSRLRDQFELVQKWAVNASILRVALFNEKPDIVHFAGHGSGEAGLIFEEGGQPKPATAEALAGLFGVFQKVQKEQNLKSIQCVLFNACFAQEQAEAVVQHVDYVIGMKQAVHDDAAISFANGFYEGLGCGLKIEPAFELGCNAICFAPPSSGNTRESSISEEPSTAENAPLEAHRIPILLKRQPERRPESPSPQISNLLGSASPFSPSNVYIHREADQKILKQIEYQDNPIAIIAPTQFGKTSLLNRLNNKLRQMGKRVAQLDLQEFRQAELADPTLFFLKFCCLLARQFGIAAPPDGKSLDCTYFIEDYLEKLEGEAVVIIDDIDKLSTASFSSDFFGMLRNWHNRGSHHDFGYIWKKLNLIVTTSIHQSELEDSVSQSIFFDVADITELADLSEQEVAELNSEYGGLLNEEQVNQLWNLLQGHPALTKQALDRIREGLFTPAQLFDSATSLNGAFSQHLNRYCSKVSREPELQQELCLILRGKVSRNPEAFYKLWHWGLVRRGEGQAVTIRCQLYATYFKENLCG
ncbi:MAG: AAA-like domain-containing protein [Elainella sp.]